MEERRHKKLMPPRQGFTLVEVLVVLAILVILFGLLFAPMMAGLDMAQTGRQMQQMQQTARMVAEQMRRELSDAVYVYPLPTIMTASGPVINYSTVLFVPPDRDPNTSQNQLVSPTRPRHHWRWDGTLGEYVDTGRILVTRYIVKPPDREREYDENNPFVLYRQEGFLEFNDTTGEYEFGSEDDSNVFQAGLPVAENALTPRINYDIPATSTVCLDCGRVEVGYVATCPDDGCAGENLLYLHRGMQFYPERIRGEKLQVADNHTAYQARHGNWMGTSRYLQQAWGGSALTDIETGLQPRIAAYRWDSVSQGYTQVALDTFSGLGGEVGLRWDARSGRLQVGEWRTVRVSVQGLGGGGPSAGSYWPLEIEDLNTGNRDAYGADGSEPSGGPTTAITPVYPRPPSTWGDPRVPVGFLLEPGHVDGATYIPAKFVPDSVRVRIDYAINGHWRRANLTVADTLDQSLIGAYQYALYHPQSAIHGDIRFNRFNPPSPDQINGVTAYDIYISFYYRRNFADDETAGYPDDVFYADYSTGEILNIVLVPQRFITLEPYHESLPNLVVPSDLPASGVPVHSRAVIKNIRR